MFLEIGQQAIHSWYFMKGKRVKKGACCWSFLSGDTFQTSVRTRIWAGTSTLSLEETEIRPRPWEVTGQDSRKEGAMEAGGGGGCRNFYWISMNFCWITISVGIRWTSLKLNKEQLGNYNLNIFPNSHRPRTIYLDRPDSVNSVSLLTPGVFRW